MSTVADSPNTPMHSLGQNSRPVGRNAMDTKPGDMLVVESETVGKPERRGEILEILEAAYGTRYRVLWDDGHESTIRPALGSARVVPVRSPASPRESGLHT